MSESPSRHERGMQKFSKWRKTNADLLLTCTKYRAAALITFLRSTVTVLKLLLFSSVHFFWGC